MEVEIVNLEKYTLADLPSFHVEVVKALQPHIIGDVQVFPRLYLPTNTFVWAMAFHMKHGVYVYFAGEMTDHTQSILIECMTLRQSVFAPTWRTAVIEICKTYRWAEEQDNIDAALAAANVPQMSEGPGEVW